MASVTKEIIVDAPAVPHIAEAMGAGLAAIKATLERAFAEGS